MQKAFVVAEIRPAGAGPFGLIRITEIMDAPAFEGTQVSALRTGVQFQHIVYSLSRHILYSFGLQNVVGKPAIDEERSLFHEVKFADQGGAEVDMGGVAKAQEADALAAQGLADEPALSPGIDLFAAVPLNTKKTSICLGSRP